MLNDLRVKLNKYEAKSAHCQRAAQEATDEPGQAFYEDLADYYGSLARDFRQVIANREAEEREQRLAVEIPTPPSDYIPLPAVLGLSGPPLERRRGGGAS